MVTLRSQPLVDPNVKCTRQSRLWVASGPWPFRLKVPLGRRAMRAGQSREQRLSETGNGITVDLVHRLRLGRAWRGSPASIADAQHRAL